MALIFKELLKSYKYAVTELADPRVSNWFLMKSPIPVITISVIYLYIILDFGPNFMKSRQPFNINKLLVGYNVLQIFACLYIAVEGIRVALIKYNIKCMPVDYSKNDEAIYVARLFWFYFILKVIDLLDTVFFILRKKENQISFLHVYHHWGMMLLSWTITKFLAGGSSMYIIVINSIVHIIMYLYYLLTAYNERFKKNIWWKKYITQIQLLQFGILLVQHLQMLIFQTDCTFPRWILLIFIPQNLMIFLLFSEFYYKAYISNSKSKSKSK